MTSQFSQINGVTADSDYNKMTYQFFNIPLNFAFNALEPHIDSRTMELHHDKHLQNYINGLNNALEPYPEFHKLTLRQILTRLNNFPSQIATAVKNNAGGVFNHFFYFEQMTPQQTQPSQDLSHLLTHYFGGVDNFVEQLKQKALSVFGSGYAWLVVNSNKNLEIVTTANQDCPLSNNMFPLINVDVWEHAYYLKHTGNRGGYFDDWFKTLNWELIDQRILSMRSPTE